MGKILGLGLGLVVMLVIRNLSPRLDAARIRSPQRTRNVVMLVWLLFATVVWFILYLMSPNMGKDAWMWLSFYAGGFVFVGMLFWIGFTVDIHRRAREKWRFSQTRCPWCNVQLNDEPNLVGCPQCHRRFPPATG